VDFLVPLGGGVLPVEVKAGKTGRLKSLQLFIAEKSTRRTEIQHRFALRDDDCWSGNRFKTCLLAAPFRWSIFQAAGIGRGCEPPAEGLLLGVRPLIREENPDR
jgi:hypothetical protein